MGMRVIYICDACGKEHDKGDEPSMPADWIRVIFKNTKHPVQAFLLVCSAECAAKEVVGRRGTYESALIEAKPYEKKQEPTKR